MSAEALPSRSTVQPGARTRMSDLARLAGCSVSTVSRALSGCPQVSPATRQRIGDLAGALRYAVHDAARNLRTQHRKTASVVVVVPGPSLHIGSSVTLAMVGAIADALANQGLDMLLKVVTERQLHTVSQAFDDGRAFGILIIDTRPLTTRLDEPVQSLVRRRVPWVIWHEEQLRGPSTVPGWDVPAVSVLDWRASTAPQACSQAFANPALPIESGALRAVAWLGQQAHVWPGKTVMPDISHLARKVDASTNPDQAI